jgi:hypothetical protein
VIDIEAPNITTTQHQWRPSRGAFEPFSTERFVRSTGGWTRV